jgi:peroxiredoxin
VGRRRRGRSRWRQADALGKGKRVDHICIVYNILADLPDADIKHCRKTDLQIMSLRETAKVFSNTLRAVVVAESANVTSYEEKVSQIDPFKD